MEYAQNATLGKRVNSECSLTMITHHCGRAMKKKEQTEGIDAGKNSQPTVTEVSCP